MSQVDRERIAFRFTRGEIAALLKVMALGELPGLDIRAEAPGIEEEASLVESGVVLLLGERTYVDRTISLVLAEAARSARSVHARAGAGRAALYRGERLWVQAQLSGDIATLEPLPDFVAARERFMQLCAPWGEEMELSLRGGDAPRSETGGVRVLEALVDALEEM